MRSRRAAIGAVLLCGGIGAAFAIAGLEADPVQSDRGAATLPGRIETYPPGRWRLQGPAELGRVVLWVSHLLIRHQGSTPDVPFGPPRWSLPSAPPERTREEALQLALRVAARAATAPADFAQLVVDVSEDAVSKRSMGSLGGITAAEFIEEPQILDALAQTPSGGVTRVVETRHGFHVFQRHAPPPEETVSGAHIVIGHDDARWLHEFGARRSIPKRTRQEALQIAMRLHEALRDAPERFSSLLDELSEHRDARWGGDIGRWSTREPTAFARELEVLRRLRVGEVAAPLDTGFGYQILRRTPERDRRRYAGRAVRLRFDPDAAESEARSRSVVQREAESLVEQIRSGRRTFDDVLRSHCCQSFVLSEEGRGNLLANDVLGQLSLGEVASKPIEWDLQFIILQRSELHTAEPCPQPLLELPAPERPDVAFFVSAMGREAAARWLAGIAHEFSSSIEGMGLSTAVREQFLQFHEGSALYPAEAEIEVRRAAFLAFLGNLERILGAVTFESYVTFIERTLESRLLTAGAVMR